MTVDWIKVGRVGHQVEIDHGRNGYLYAERLATKAREEFRNDDADFWSAVAASLRPRDISNDVHFP
jgi:hypothetical protein